MSFDDSLADWLQQQPGLLPLPTVASIVRKAADELQKVHNQQKIYQDVNPTNFLVHVQGEPAERIALRLADLDTPGHAALQRSRGYPANSILAYTAPEQWLGQPVAATDQYALAVMAYELLTGMPPFQGPPAQLMELHLKVQPPAPSSIHARVTPTIDAVLQSALAKSPEERFPSISAFSRALEQAIVHPEALVVNTPVDGNLHVTLLISMSEALMGTLRSVTLPNGRRITVAVPKGAYDGQIVQLEGFGEPSSTSGQLGALLLTLSVSPTETSIPKVQSTPPRGPSMTSPPPRIPSIPSFLQIKQLPTLVANVSQRGRAIATGLYTTVARLSARGKGVLLASLVLLLVLVSAGIFFLVQTSRGVSIPYPPYSGSLALTDALQNNGGGYSWPDGTSVKGGTCRFSQGAYHVLMTQVGSFHSCIAGSTRYSNFAYEVRMTIHQGDGGGILFRANGTKGSFYYFLVGREGSYGLYLYTSAAGSQMQTLTSGRAAAIQTGLDIPNRLAIVARGNTIDLYVNRQRIDGVTNNSYDSGQIGVAAASETGITEVIFSNAQVWTF